MAAIDYIKPEYYTNRELSWLDFNMRILGEARDKKNPLFERIKFLSITASNLSLLKGYGSCEIYQTGYCRAKAGGTAGLDPGEGALSGSASIFHIQQIAGPGPETERIGACDGPRRFDSVSEGVSGSIL